MSLDESLGPITIFTGVARSGTTLLGDLANRYLDVAAVNEGCFELWLNDQVPEESCLSDDRFLGSLLDRLARHDYFHMMYGKLLPPHAELVGLLRAELTERTLEGVAVAVLRFSRNALGRSRLGHEDPRLMTNLGGLMRVLPRCRIVHIIRDPRDTATSILKFPWGANNPVVAAMGWDSRVAEARALGRTLGPDRYLEIRYEDLLRRPTETMTALMQFICGDVQEALLTQFAAEMDSNPRRNNSGTWRQGLTPAQVSRVEAVAGRQMAELGYEPVSAPRTLSRAELSFWKLHHRAYQLKGIVVGRLSVNGGSKLELEPEGSRHPEPLMAAR